MGESEEEIGLLSIEPNIDDIEDHILEILITGAPTLEEAVKEQIETIKELADLSEMVTIEEFGILETPYGSLPRPIGTDLKNVDRKKWRYIGEGLWKEVFTD